MCNNHQTDRKNPSVGTAKEMTIKRTAQQPPNQVPKSTRQKQHNLIKTYHKKFQERRQVNELCTPANDSGKEFNNFISEF